MEVVVMVTVSTSCSSVCEEEEGERAPSSGPGDKQREINRVKLQFLSWPPEDAVVKLFYKHKQIH